MAAAALGSRILRQAADAYDRAARPPYGRIPPPSLAGNRLRQAARLLSAFAYLTGDRSMAPIVLITRLAALAEAVAEMRESQRHAAQAAAERLYASTRPASAPSPRSAPHATNAAPIRGAVLPADTPQPSAARTPTARHRSGRPTATTQRITTTPTRPQPLSLPATPEGRGKSHGPSRIPSRSPRH